ncbi:MAG TPA: hypothetical protein VKU19_07615 [Bryobacteraceae bacterium]|nr:hypothetical protein [Bryobacteraceae bacterium]
MRIVDAAKGRYYDAAVSNFDRAKRCFVRVGLATDWEAVRSSHHRKSGFLQAFAAIVAVARDKKVPSFLERAKARWGGKRAGGPACKKEQCDVEASDRDDFMVGATGLEPVTSCV